MESPTSTSTYAQRFAAMWDFCGPGSWRYLSASAADVAAARATLAAPSPGGPPPPPAALAEARRVLSATTHPDTGELIPLPLRMAAHVPCNALLLAAMLSARSVRAVAATQFLNQAFNAAQFYANKNRSNDVPPATLAASFAAAAVAAVGVGAGLQWALERAPPTTLASSAAGGGGGGASRARALAALAVPFLGAAAAKPLQISILRADEATEGVLVSTADGAAVGRSRAAGRRAIGLTIITRVVYLAPMLWIAPLHAAVLRKLPSALAGAPGASAAALVALSAANSAIATPAVIALFDARASARAGELEPHLAAAVGPDTLLYFNKGI